jgi:hypothetical protein
MRRILARVTKLRESLAFGDNRLKALSLFSDEVDDVH